jgi:hypothetical protein
VLQFKSRVQVNGLTWEKDPERAEWLRLEMTLHSRATDDPAVLARFIDLTWKIGLERANPFLRDKILNCGSAGAKPTQHADALRGRT